MMLAGRNQNVSLLPEPEPDRGTHGEINLERKGCVMKAEVVVLRTVHLLCLRPEEERAAERNFMSPHHHRAQPHGYPRFSVGIPRQDREASYEHSTPSLTKNINSKHLCHKGPTVDRIMVQYYQEPNSEGSDSEDFGHRRPAN